MPGTKINSYSAGDPQPDHIMETLDMSNRGENRISLTEYHTAMRPGIAQGSIIDIAGAFIEFQSIDDIAGSPSDGDVFITINPETLSASFTNTPPTWRSDYQGWYDSTGINRYLPYVIDKSESSWMKAEIVTVNNKVFRIYADGSVHCQALTVNGTLSVGDLASGTTINGQLVADRSWANNRFSLIGHTHNYASKDHDHDDDTIRPENIFAGYVYGKISGSVIQGPKKAQVISLNSTGGVEGPWGEIRAVCENGYEGVYIASGYVLNSGSTEIITEVSFANDDNLTVYIRTYNGSARHSYSLNSEGVNNLPGTGYLYI